MPFRKIKTDNFTPENSLRVLGQASHSGFGQKINLLVWNIYKARRQNWLVDFKRLIHEQHLIILQEAVFKSTYDAFFEDSVKFEWVMARSFRKRHSGLETGVKTGSVTPSIGRTPIFSEYSEPVVNTPKLVLSTHYVLQGSEEKLLVLNIHAINFVSLKKYTSQLEQFKREIGNHIGPIILAGDFNTWSLGRYMRFKQIAFESGLLEAAIIRPRRIQHLNQHLDHVFYRGLLLQEIKTISTIDTSDHE